MMYARTAIGVIVSSAFVFFAIAVPGIDQFLRSNAIYLIPLDLACILVALCLLGRLEDLRNRFLFIVLLSAHYGINLLFLVLNWNHFVYDEPHALIGYWKTVLYQILFVILLYILGHLAIWFLFFNRIGRIEIFYKFLFGLIYTCIYFFMALVSAGAGHGTAIFFAPLIPWFLLFIALYLSTKVNDSRSRIFFVATMATHYLLVAFYLRDILTAGIDEGTLKMWNYAPGLMIETLVFYLLGQFVIWLMFYYKLRKRAFV